MLLPEQPNKKPDLESANYYNIATKAFELRIAGRVDEAKDLLEEAVAENPKDASAQFELARVYFYISCETLDLDLAQKTIVHLKCPLEALFSLDLKSLAILPTRLAVLQCLVRKSSTILHRGST